MLFRPIGTTVIVALVALFLPGCGRWGFDLSVVGQDKSASVPGESAEGELDAAALEPDGGDGRPQRGVVEGVLPDGGVALADSAVPDVASESDAGEVALLPAPFPLSAPLRCREYSRVVACDDFDGHDLGANVAPGDDGNTVTVAQGFVTAGVPGIDQRAAVQSSFSAVDGGQLFLRFSLYVPGDVVLSGLNIASIGRLDDVSDFGLDLNLEGDSMFVYTTGDNHVARAAYVMPRDRWTCVLLKVANVDSSTGSVRVYMDGTRVLSASNIDTRPSSGIVGAAAGIDWAFREQGATTIYIDGFLVTRDPPGLCP